MIGGIVLGIFILVAAASLGLIEKALGPDSGRFPCVTKELLWSSRILTMVLAARGFFIINRSYHGELAPIDLDQYISAFTLAAFLLMLLLQIIRQRLPIGTWRKLQARHERVRQAAKAGGAAGAVLARVAVDAPAAGPGVPTDVPASMRPALEALAKRD